MEEIGLGLEESFFLAIYCIQIENNLKRDVWKLLNFWKGELKKKHKKIFIK